MTTEQWRRAYIEELERKSDDDKRCVSRTRFEDGTVLSTVKLIGGLSGYETMLIRPDSQFDPTLGTYETYAEALEGHKRALRQVEDGDD